MRKVEVKEKIHVPPSLVITSFTEEEMLKDWWRVERALIEKKPNGLYTLAWQITGSGFWFVSTGTIGKYQAGRELVVENMVYLNPEKPFLGPMKLTVNVKEDDGSSLVYICQEGYQSGSDWDWYYEAVKDAWPVVIVTLKEYLEKIGRKK